MLELSYAKLPRKHQDTNVPQEVIDAHVKTLMWLGDPEDILGDIEGDVLCDVRDYEVQTEMETLEDWLGENGDITGVYDEAFDEFWSGMEEEGI